MTLMKKKLADVAHRAGVAYTLHICGNTDVILEHMLLSGADAYELDYKTDITKIFNTFHNCVTLIGNIDPSGVLALGSAELVRKRDIGIVKCLSAFKSLHSECRLCNSSQYAFQKT
ncbi:MAG: uroporphyrinogen decarboxylase family protein [Mangrovibacterium sp.]